MANREEARPGEREPRGGTEPRSAREAASGPEGLLTLVCITCGNEKTYADQAPARLVCEKCGSTVFRNFFTPTTADEATIAHLEETARSIAYDEESPDTTPDEVRDVNNP